MGRGCDGDLDRQRRRALLRIVDDLNLVCLPDELLKPVMQQVGPIVWGIALASERSQLLLHRLSRLDADSWNRIAVVLELSRTQVDVELTTVARARLREWFVQASN